MHILPFSHLLFNGNTKCYFPNNNHTEAGSKSNISKAFESVYAHAKTRLQGLQPKLEEANPYAYQFPEYGHPKGNVIAYTGELEGVFGTTPVLLSSFARLPAKPILDDMVDKMYVSKPFTVPAITYPNPGMVLANVTEADVDNVLGPMQ